MKFPKTFLLYLLVIVLIFGFIGWKLYFTPADDSMLNVAATVESTSTFAARQLASVPGNEAPLQLIIPKLRIDADVLAMGVTAKGNMDAPHNFTDVSWYMLGTVPGRLGSAVMAGHEDNAISLDGVFKHLDDLVIGDDVYVVRKDGVKLHFQVVDKKVYPYNLSGPELEKVFTANDATRLNLITCTGHWVQEIHTNDKRLVVFTKLVKD